jgi:hypothetical protein
MKANHDTKKYVVHIVRYCQKIVLTLFVQLVVFLLFGGDLWQQKNRSSV